jgi:flagellar basal-body rod protein FlgB
MIDDFLYSKTKIPLLQKALGAYTQREKVIAGNVANIGTIGYKRKDVEFETHFNDALTLGGAQPLAGEMTQPMHMAINSSDPNQLETKVTQSNTDTDSLASGVNNVDIDVEMSELAENQIRFKFASRLIAESFKGLRRAISGTESGS